MNDKEKKLSKLEKELNKIDSSYWIIHDKIYVLEREILADKEGFMEFYCHVCSMTFNYQTDFEKCKTGKGVGSWAIKDGLCEYANKEAYDKKDYPNICQHPNVLQQNIEWQEERLEECEKKKCHEWHVICPKCGGIIHGNGEAFVEQHCDGKCGMSYRGSS